MKKNNIEDYNLQYVETIEKILKESMGKQFNEILKRFENLLHTSKAFSKRRLYDKVTIGNLYIKGNDFIEISDLDKEIDKELLLWGNFIEKIQDAMLSLNADKDFNPINIKLINNVNMTWNKLLNLYKSNIIEYNYVKNKQKPFYFRKIFIVYFLLLILIPYLLFKGFSLISDYGLGQIILGLFPLSLIFVAILGIDKFSNGKK